MDSAAQFLPWLVPLCPLVGFFINAFLGHTMTKESPATSEAVNEDEQTDAHARVADSHAHGSDNSKSPVGFIATLAVAASFALALMLFFQVTGMSGEEKRIFSTKLDWMQSAASPGFSGLDLSFRLMVDPLTSLMLLIITGIGTLIHLYSIGYMAHEKGYARYFAYLNLFVFFMLLLVMGSNLLVLFVGWEGVGLASTSLSASPTSVNRQMMRARKRSSSTVSATAPSSSHFSLFTKPSAPLNCTVPTVF